MQLFYEIPHHGQCLRGIVHRPQGIEKAPCVIMFHGFTGNRMEFSFGFVELSRMLEKSGIASARFDFMGSGESDGDFIDMTISGEVSDAGAVLDYMKGLDFFDPDRIGVLGMSLGGVVASLLAGQRPEEILCLGLWAPAAIVSEHVRNGQVGRQKITPEDYQKGYVDLRGLKLGTAFLEDVLSFDIFDTAAQFKKDVLLIHGTRDEAVPFKISEQYKQKYGKRAKLLKLEGAGHGFESVSYRQTLLENTLAFFVNRLSQ